MSDNPNPETTVEEAGPETQAGDEIILKLQDEARSNLEGWQRARAEFANYKKRVEGEMKSASDRGAFDALLRMLPIMDDFGRALDNVPADLVDNPWLNGTALIMKHFTKVLEAYGVDEIDPVGQTFDPHRHEAIGMDEGTDYPSGTVTATLQKGYASGDRVLRPALVRVAS